METDPNNQPPTNRKERRETLRLNRTLAEVDADPAPVEEKAAEEVAPDEPIKIADIAQTQRDAFLAQVAAARARNVKPVHVPPTPTARQMSQNALEAEAGRKRLEYYTAQELARVKPVVDGTEGSITPVKVDGGHAPNFDSKDPGYLRMK